MNIDQISVAHLSKLLKSCEREIVEGNNKLSLTASLLQKINYALQEFEYNHISASSSTCDLEESVKYLQELIHKTPKLTVTQKVKRETWRIDLSRFSTLRYLELNRVPMHLVEGIQSLRSQIEVLICEKCTDCLEEILGTSDQVWEELRTVKLCYNDFVFLCPFTNTPWLQYLDLSYNKIEDRLSLRTLNNLKYLNLSFNLLTSVPVLSEEVSRTLQVLLLNNNYIQDLAAISTFDALGVLDVSNNLLSDHSAISPILFLPNLRSINLRNNPISYHPHHRFHTCSYLNKGIIPDEFLLDGKPLTLLEQREIGRRGETFRNLGISLPRDLTCLPSSSTSHSAARSLSKKKVRDVVIEDGTASSKSKVIAKPLETSQEHLQTRKQLEDLRERFGEDHWLHSHAGSFVQDLMGLQKSTGSGILSSTPLMKDMFPPSPKLNSPLLKVESGSPGRFESSASEDYVSAITTQAIIEAIPKNIEISTSESSDQEQKEKNMLLTSSDPEVQTETELKNETKEEKSSDEMTIILEFENEEVEEQENNDNGQLWLVQKKQENGDLSELFVTLNEKEIHEKSTVTGRTTTKWSLESVKSCEKVSNDPPTIHLNFNTVRKAYQERTYVMEFADAQELLKRVRSFLEARSLSAMNQVAFRCMKCSSMFSVEVQPTVLPSIVSTLETGVKDCRQAAKCPTCGSTLVVEMEEAPLPSADKESDPIPPITVTSSTSPIKHSSSDGSIGSANSLEQRLDVGGNKEGTPTPRRYDSDIEVISNPSQSSIEVLEVQARLQGSLTPNRKRSSEERSTVAVPQLNTVPEVQPNMAGLTESSSSGSLTDSVCTTYETNPVPARRSGMSDVPEEATPTSTPANTYTSLLEDLIQNVNSRLTPKNSPCNGSFLDNKVPYSFLDFSRVDHRVKFYLYQNAFKDDNEDLLFLVRGYIMISTGELLPGCLVVSTHSVYILHVISPEIGDDASCWYQSKDSYHLSEMSTVFPLPWQLGAGFCLGSMTCLVILSNPLHSSNLLIFLKEFLNEEASLLKKVSMEDQSPTNADKLLKQLISQTVANSSGPVDLTPSYLTLCSSVITRKDKGEVLDLLESPLLITTTDLLLIQPNFAWLLPSSNMLPRSTAEQKLANIIEVTSSSELELSLHFLNETENVEEVWSLVMSSTEALNRIVENIRNPWEQLFSVPLQVTRNH